tara:strand:+ start:4885 stop:5280 length:396 start_codon:yes stop_codon:yes gene_type:complete
MPTFQTFKDLSVTFKTHPVTDDLVCVKDKAAIVQAIQNLILTEKGERPFQPTLGCGVRNILFEPLDYGSAALIKAEIAETLVTYEPRIQIDTIGCNPDFQNNGFNVELSYQIVGIDDGRTVAVEFFLERTR